VAYTNGDGEILYSVRTTQVKSLFSQTREEMPEKVANEIEAYENEMNDKFERESGIINRKKGFNEDHIYEITILKQTSKRPPAFTVKLLYKYGDIKEVRNVNPDDLSHMYEEASLPIPSDIKDIIENYVSTNYQFSADDTREKSFFP
jgi:urate oxidase